jgi:glycosyltransferase involved in cell wall biosynthesis
VRKEIDHVKMLIVGRGALMSSLQDMAAEKGLQADIIFAGERSDIPAILFSIDIFAMSSEREGLPNALLEAMAAAKPVLVTSAGGMKEIVQDTVNGLVVPICEPQMLARGMKHLIRDRQSAEIMGKTAREYIEKNYSIHATARAWEDLYKELVHKKNDQGSGLRAGGVC